jgi:hypothetical protein
MDSARLTASASSVGGSSERPNVQPPSPWYLFNHLDLSPETSRLWGGGLKPCKIMNPYIYEKVRLEPSRSDEGFLSVFTHLSATCDASSNPPPAASAKYTNWHHSNSSSQTTMKGIRRIQARLTLWKMRSIAT